MEYLKGNGTQQEKLRTKNHLTGNICENGEIVVNAGIIKDRLIT